MSQFHRTLEKGLNIVQAVFSSDMRRALQLDGDVSKLVRSASGNWPMSAIERLQSKLMDQDAQGNESREAGTNFAIQREISIGALVGAISHDSRNWVRNAAAQALSGTRHPVALEKLVIAIFDSEWTVSASASCAVFASIERGPAKDQKPSEYYNSIARMAVAALNAREWPYGSEFNELGDRNLTGVSAYSPRGKLHKIILECCDRGKIDEPLLDMIGRGHCEADRCRALHNCFCVGLRRDVICHAAAKIAHNRSEPVLVRRYADRLAASSAELDYSRCFDDESLESLERTYHQPYSR